MNNKIKDILNKYQNESCFSYQKPTKKQLENVEQILNFKLPEYFIWFLDTYGA